MRKRLILVVTFLVVLLIGIAIGSSRKSSSKSGSSAATTTVTTFEKTAVPAACRRAIAQARQLGVMMRAALTDVTPIFGMVPAAAKAGAAQNTSQIYALAGRLKGVNGKLENLTPASTAIILKFNTDAKACH